jgi:hypothetical protein
MPSSSSSIDPSIRRTHFTNEAFALARTIVRWAFGGLYFWIFYQIIVVVAGKDTVVLFKIIVNGLVEMRVILPTAVCGVAVTWALAERNLRRRQMERLHPRVKDLETKIDPKRSTSTLTARGDTNPSDRGR